MPTWICYGNPCGQNSGLKGGKGGCLTGKGGGRDVCLLEMEEVLFLAQALVYSV